MDTEKKWIIITVISLGMLFCVIFAPFMVYFWDDGIHYENNYIYFNGDWMKISDDGSGEILEEGDLEYWEGNFKISGFILLLLGISFTIISSIALIFEINFTWNIILRVILIIGSLLSLIGMILYVSFADYATALIPNTLHVNFIFILLFVSPPLIVMFSIFNLVGTVIKARRRMIEKSSV